MVQAPKRRSTQRACIVAVGMALASSTSAFMNQRSVGLPLHSGSVQSPVSQSTLQMQLPSFFGGPEDSSSSPNVGKMITSFAASAALVATIALTPAFAENELSDKYGGKGFDSSLVDQTCLVDRCGDKAKACLADDPSCRKGLTCTAKCLGDNSCITGCMARYGNKNLDNFLKCTIEDHECIKIAILPGGADRFGEEPRAPAPTVRNFDYKTLEGTWYKVVGFNPNYDCYACQRNSFEMPEQKDGLLNVVNMGDRLNVGVEFSMPHLLPDGTPPPPRNVRESIMIKNDAMFGMKSVGLNEYQTNEVMVFDKQPDPASTLVVNKGENNEVSYSRTAHSEGEMFGLKFWENWYVIGENDPDSPEFKFIYYNGKTRQNTYDGAFVYSRSRSLEPESMKKVYQIAKNAGMNPDQFCSIRNGCFGDVDGPNAATTPLFKGEGVPTIVYPGAKPADEKFRGIMASTKVSELLGVEAVSARDAMGGNFQTSSDLQPARSSSSRGWWYEVGDYFENPHRHFETMQELRQVVEWPEDVVKSARQ